MKKKLLTFVGLLSISLAITHAQDYEKPVVYIDYFTRPTSVSSEYAEVLRGKVLEGIQATGRVHLVDVASEEKLNSEEERRKAESAMTDATARTTQMKTLGANYIVTAEIIAMNAEKKTDDKGKTYYKGEIRWNIKVIDAATGTLKKTSSYEHSGWTGSTGDTPLKAITSTCDYAKNSMDDLAEAVFPLIGTVLKVETVSKKGDKAESVIIDLGKTHGVSKGQRFMVFVEIDIAGEVGEKEVGTVTANEVLSANRTICKVSKGNQELLKAMNAGQNVKIQTRVNKLLEF